MSCMELSASQSTKQPFAAADSAPLSFRFPFFLPHSHKYHPFLHRCPTLFLFLSPSIETFNCLIFQYLPSTYSPSNHEILRPVLFILFTCSRLTASPSITAFLQYGVESATFHFAFHQRHPSVTRNIVLVESHTYRRDAYLSRRPKTFTRRGRIEPRGRLLPSPTSGGSAAARE